MGFNVIYSSDPSRGFTSCYWADNRKEAEQYADMVRKMFPNYEVHVVEKTAA